MKNKKSTFIMSGNIITPTIKESSKKQDLSGLNEMFDNPFSENEDPMSTKEAQKKKESKKIKDLSWESIKSPSRNKDIRDGKVISPSGASDGGETYYSASKSKLPEGKASIFDPEAFKNVMEDEFSSHPVKARKQREKKSEATRHPEREVELKAKTTSDVAASAMGFTPSKSGIKQPEMKKTKIAEIDQIKKQQKSNKMAGEQVAELKNVLDNEFKNKMEERFGSNDLSWEEEKMIELSQNQNKDFSSKQPKMEFTSEKTVLTPSGTSVKASADLSGLFKVPNIKEEKTNIKKSTASIQKKRKSRSEDRSWESVKKSRKF